MMSPVVPANVRIDFLPIWDFGQNVITFAYGVCLRKQLYGRNQRDEMVAVALVSYDSENFDF
jgi:hypothetical protein